MVRNKIQQGKTKILFSYPENVSYICQHFSDNITAYNNEKSDCIDGKGVVCNYISAYVMEKLNRVNIKTHFIKTMNMREQVIKRLTMFPFEVVVRNVAHGSLARKLPIAEGTFLSKPLVEVFFKDDANSDPLITEDHIYLLKLATPEQVEEIFEMALRINDFVLGVFAAANIQLVDIKLEFGTDHHNNIVLGDEISPDTSRLWNQDHDDEISVLDKDCFRKDLSDVLTTYQKVAEKLGILNYDI